MIPPTARKRNTSTHKTIRPFILALLVTLSVSLKSEEMTIQDLDSAIFKNLTNYNANVSIRHSAKLINYINRCEKETRISVKPFRNRLDKYRVEVECYPDRSYKDISELTGTISTLVTTKKIRRKTPLKKDHYKKKQRDIRSVRGSIAMEIPDLYYFAKRSLGTDEVIYKKHLEIRPTIEIGQEVFIQAMSHGISVQVKGTALEEGMTNQRIGVENNSSGVPIEAIIINNNTVRVK